MYSPGNFGHRVSTVLFKTCLSLQKTFLSLTIVRVILVVGLNLKRIIFSVTCLTQNSSQNTIHTYQWETTSTNEIAYSLCFDGVNNATRMCVFDDISGYGKFLSVDESFCDVTKEYENILNVSRPLPYTLWLSFHSKPFSIEGSVTQW